MSGKNSKQSAAASAPAATKAKPAPTGTPNPTTKGEAAAKRSGFEKGRDYVPNIGLVAVSVASLQFKQRGAPMESKYSDILAEASKLAVGAAYIVTEEDASVTAAQLFQRVSPYIRRHSLTANANGALKIATTAANQVVVFCVDRASIKARKARERAVVPTTPAAAPAAPTA